MGDALLRRLLLALSVAGTLIPAPCRAQATAAEPVREGRRIYMEGRLATGEVVSATVQGDVPLDGSQFTCVSCHRRSGMGAIEGERVVAAVTGPELFQARSGRYAPRPSYTEETLARAIREGIDPAGRALDPLMPLYRLPESGMAALIAYLKQLGAAPSPGVTDEEIHFATIVAPGADPERERAMLAVLETFFDEKNRETRAEERRAKAGPFYRDYINLAFRRWVLHVWRLEGPPETWGPQLDAHYAAEPVFAALSGLGVGEWRPIHEFCEKSSLPCVLPNTELPPLDDDLGYYSIYFFRGVAIEAEAIARHLAGDGAPESPVLQVFRADPAGRTAAAALREALSRGGGRPVTDWRVAAAAELSPQGLAERLAAARAAVLVLWLGESDLALVAGDAPPGAERLYVSSVLLESRLDAVPDSLRPDGFAAQPYTLSRERRGRGIRVNSWLQARGIGSPHALIQSQTYFACRLVGQGLAHIKRNFFRDYLIDTIDHAEAMAPYSVYHPRLSFGPGQRVLSKGCYVAPLGGGPEGILEPQAAWIVP